MSLDYLLFHFNIYKFADILSSDSLILYIFTIIYVNYKILYYYIDHI